MSQPQLRRVDSSSVEAAGYDPQTRRLFLRFRGSGKAYVYYGVEARVFDELLTADSIGRYVNDEIKGVYSFSRL